MNRKKSLHFFDFLFIKHRLLASTQQLSDHESKIAAQAQKIKELSSQVEVHLIRNFRRLKFRLFDVNFCVNSRCNSPIRWPLSTLRIRLEIAIQI
jgi:hypothetical protein